MPVVVVSGGDVVVGSAVSGAGGDAPLGDGSTAAVAGATRSGVGSKVGSTVASLSDADGSAAEVSCSEAGGGVVGFPGVSSVPAIVSECASVYGGAHGSNWRIADGAKRGTGRKLDSFRGNEASSLAAGRSR